MNNLVLLFETELSVSIGYGPLAQSLNIEVIHLKDKPVIHLSTSYPNMSITAKLGNEFLCIPKLNVSGSNWVIFKDCFI